MSDEGYMEDGYSVKSDGFAYCRHVSGNLERYETYWNRKILVEGRKLIGSFDAKQLRDIDPDLSKGLDEEFEIFRFLIDANNPAELQRHGQSLMRGLALAGSVLRSKGKFNLNTARPQKGLGVHPGKPPRARTQAWHEWYKSYLECTEWEQRRQKVLTRANGHCEGCGSAEATQVHHLTYEHAGHEFLFELTAICAACHSRLHRKTPP